MFGLKLTKHSNCSHIDASGIYTHQMARPGEKSPTSTALLPSPNRMRPSQHSEMSDELTVETQELLRQDVKHLVKKAILSEPKPYLLTHHSLCRLQHISCDGPIRFMMFSEAAAAFIALHMDNTVCLYKAYGHKQTLLTHLPFKGLTVTKIAGCLLGWGPGPILTLMDSSLHPLVTADSVLDIQICEAAEHSTELVTAGTGNVCVWSIKLMQCKVKVQEGLQQCCVFTHMALAPPQPGKPHRGFVVSGQTVTVVDLDEGRVVEHKKDLCSCDITAMAYCFKLDCLIVASQELFITVWGPDWEPRVSFLGHNDVVNSLFYCPTLNMLVSSSVDCTIRTWDVEECEAVQCVHTKQKTPPLHIGGTGKGDAFFSFSHQGVDFWTVRSLYTLCCELRGDEGATLRQIVVSHVPAPYPTRVLCLSGDNQITLVAAETGAMLTSFKAKDRLLCADYCIHREILLALTEAGTVLKANTLTNPITLMQEWKDRGQEPWEHEHCMTENYAQNLSAPGPACCLVLYSCVADTKKALEEWESLQEGRGCSYRKYREIDDAENKFLILTGQSGGCVSVLKINDGNVLYRTPAHNGQKVTTMQAYPEKRYLLSTGDDLTVVVWRVYPYVKECLTQLLSLQCGQPQVYLSVLGSQLALTCQESCSLKFFSLLNQKQTDYQPREGHSDHFTGLCVFPEMKLFVSSSLDKTVRIWNDENRLIRTLYLQAVPECVAYSGFGELFLGIKGNLYRMKCAKYLPLEYNKMVLNTHCVEPCLDVPIPKTKETYNQTKTSKDETDKSQAVTSKQLLIGSMQEPKYLVSMNNNLEALLQGTVKYKKEKLRQIRKEAFDRYMNIIYDLPPSYKIDREDTFDLGEYSFYAKSKYTRPHKFPKLKEDRSSQPKPDIPVRLEKNKQKKALPTLMKVMLQPEEKVPLEKSVTVEKVVREMKPQEIITPKQPQPKLPTPPHHQLRTPAPLAQPETFPQVASFLNQFTEMGWFNDLFPDKKSIPSNLSPEDFCLKLLNYQLTCSSTCKNNVLDVIQALHSQGLLLNTDKLYKGLINNLPKFARPHMSAMERAILTEMLSLLVRLKSEISYDLVKKLLTLLAYKELEVRKVVLGLLVLSGVDEAEEWLWPELENWDSELQEQSNPWASLHGRADCWLELWLSKFKRHKQCLVLGSTKCNPPNVSVVDVLNYFCYVQKEEHSKTTNVPAAHQDRAILPLHDCCSKPIICLSETNSMKRIRKPPGIILPPMIKRPSLMDFPNFITLPLPRVTLCTFHNYPDEDRLKESIRSYFIQEQSWVEYYRW
ncbi:WD repeat-containing protein 97 [Melanotaenia boesemani]|uniref:WD repeat-containing protein 97 n=1 Tax=Melanotaenia boesemani TaxID=1250792 RepID=UPI001C049ADF|nr:WD repeat-containing protein 97 [Melanotaenia boesemani]